MQVRFSTFPRFQTPPAFVAGVVDVFERHSGEIGTAQTKKSLTSDQALAVLRLDLVALSLGRSREAKTISSARSSSTKMPSPICSTKSTRGLQSSA